MEDNSTRFNLNTADIRVWFQHNFLPAAAPILLVGLLALQQGFDWKIAATMIWTASLTTLIDLTRRFISEGH